MGDSIKVLPDKDFVTKPMVLVKENILCTGLRNFIVNLKLSEKKKRPDDAQGE